MRHTPIQTTLPPSLLSKNFLQSISPSQSASPSVAQYSAGLAHDARNMLAAMDIYCELLASPGVLKPEDRHLLEELRLLRDSSGKLLDRLLVEALKCLASSESVPAHGRSRVAGNSQGLTANLIPSSVLYDPADAYGKHEVFASAAGPALPHLSYSGSVAAGSSTLAPDLASPASALEGAAARPANSPRESGKRVTNVAKELQANLPMLSALAGPRVHVSLETAGCPEGELFMPPVDLTRVLINLVRNAAEAMSIGGRILISATGAMLPAAAGPASDWPGVSSAVMIAIEDNGPGIPLSLLDRIFDLQVSTATLEESTRPRMQFRPRGLGLRIVREFVEASGGSVRALRLPDRGSRFEIVLPMVTVKVTQVESAL